MHLDILAILLLIVVGVLAFLLGLVYMVASVVGGIGNAMISAFYSMTGIRPPRRHGTRGTKSSPDNRDTPHVVCPEPKCKKVEPRPAMFCSRCGTTLNGDKKPVSPGMNRNES